MGSIDFKTVFFIYVLTDIICLVVVAILWLQNRKRFKGTHLFVIDFAFQVIALLLIFLRGSITDFYSIIVSNTLSVVGIFLGIIGLELFLNKRSNHLHNYLLIVLFIFTHIYFTYIQPSLSVRNLNSALIYLSLCSQIVWLTIFRVNKFMRKITLGIGLIFLIYSSISILKIINFFNSPQSVDNYFNSSVFEIFVIILYQLLFLLFTFFLALMFNKRLQLDITLEEEKFSKAFHSTPYAILLTRLNDGRIIEANQGFQKITDHQIFDIIGKTTIDLKLWRRANDRENLLEELSEKKRIQEREVQFQRKNGNFFTALFSAEILNINNERHIFSIINDISEQKKSADALRNEQKLLRTLIDNLPDAIYVKDSECRKIVANLADIKNIGLHSEAEALGKTDVELFDTEIGQRGLADDLHVIQSGEAVVDREEVFFNDKGKQHWLLTSKFPLFDKNGKITGLVGIGRDITQQKRATETIKQERELLRTLIDNIPFAIYVKDSNARKLIANLADLNIINCKSEAEVVGKTDLELFDNINGESGYNEDMTVLQTGSAIINKENGYIDHEGKFHWRVISKIPLYDSERKIIGLVGIGRDITEQKRATETIQKLSKSIEQSPSATIITNVEGAIEYVNPKFLSLTGYLIDEIIGKNPRVLKSGETPEEVYSELWETITSGGVWHGELHNRKKNGELFWERATITSIKNDEGQITNFIAMKEDISFGKQMEVDLLKAKEKAEENDRLKTAFLANMSHEIRTPLNSIIGFSELLTVPKLDDNDRLTFAELIFKSGNNLLSIINDIIDISKIESGQVELSFSEFDANDLLESVVCELSLKAKSKGIELRTTIDSRCKNLMINSDRNKLKQVLTNFVSNALKFTDNGYVEIELTPSENGLRFSVKDTGIGIPYEYHETIFERFRQIESSHTRKYGGNGLGLAISKSLIEMVSGTIGMESELGVGSVFYFTIPYKKA